ncbi:fungal-specific transcription factor domain-containing protein [Fusarium tricinctum]|uniref:Fungal-specific transcription factor domain-containing protein n=1 Tax=Fusarium tricinctum TaxID=61284 RepID=A0A8K0RJX6_9HYPO|nr:fungal-specific transcription factor domain-containing protein [Fusarium tricinctum]
MEPLPESRTRRISTPPSLPQRKSVACRPCHARKIKCSGNKPCNNCNRASECIYPTRDRQVKVQQSFIDRLLHENAELRARLTQSESPQTRNTSTPWHHSPTPNNDDNTTQDQILEESDWFTHTRSSDTPIWIGEISDAAFATRFRQFASASQIPNHIPRTQFTSEDTLRDLAATTPIWLPSAQSRFLVETSLEFLRHNYHIVRRSEVLSALDSIPFGQPSLGPPSTIVAKIWALFAIGELRSRKCVTSSNGLPGMKYFAIASETIRLIHERPQLDMIETILLLVKLALYSLEANRRHSACTYVGAALRHATIMGLHMNIGDTYIPDPELREHRIRVWWSVYILDRLLSSKIGLPLSISDDDISVKLPSDVSTLNSKDFGDHTRFVAILRLARIAGDISRTLYVRTPQRCTFLQRVAKIREDLELWRGELPGSIKFDSQYQNNTSLHPQSKTSTLQLAYNQLLVLATRPVLLYIFRQHINKATTTSTDSRPSEQVADVADVCIGAARQSCRILLQSWVNGEFHIFDYSYVRYLFSSATILAISSTLDRDTSPNDKDEFNLAIGFLQQLEQNGNPAAMEFYAHIDETRKVLETRLSIDDCLNTLPTCEGSGPQLPTQAFPSSLDDQSLTTAIGTSATGPHGVDESPLTVSFLDDWIYDNALQQLRWQE